MIILQLQWGSRKNMEKKAVGEASILLQANGSSFIIDELITATVDEPQEMSSPIAVGVMLQSTLLRDPLIISILWRFER